MAEEQGYNGWKNYETWAMALWIDNEPGTYAESREIVRNVLPSESDLEAFEARTGEEFTRTNEGLAADALKDWMEETMPELEASVWSDLLSAALSEVDWYEIASNYLEEITEEASR